MMNKNLKIVRNGLIILAFIICIILFLPLEKIEASYYNNGISSIETLLADKSAALGRTITISEEELKNGNNKYVYCIATSAKGHSEQSVFSYIRIQGNKARVYIKSGGTTYATNWLTYDDNAELAFILGGKFKINNVNIPTGYGPSEAKENPSLVSLRQYVLWKNIENINILNNQLTFISSNNSQVQKKLYTWSENNDISHAGRSELWLNYGESFKTAMNNYVTSMKNDYKEATITKQDTTVISTNINDKSERLGPFKFTYTGNVSVSVTDVEDKAISSSDIKITNSTGTVLTSIPSGSNFYIRNYSGKDAKKVEFTATYTVKNAIFADVYILSKSGTQPTMAAKTETKDYKTTATISYDITRDGKIVINKKDADTNATLKAGFKIQTSTGYLKVDANGNYTYANYYSEDATTFYSQNGVLTISGLRYGNYKIWEVEAPEGYILSTQIGYQTRKADDNLGSITGVMIGSATGTQVNATTKTIAFDVTNRKPGKITIVKKDGVTGKSISGSKITLQDSAGNYYDVNGTNKGTAKTEITVPSEGITIENLNFGTYTIKEVGAPSGYKLELQTSDEITKAVTIQDNVLEDSITINNYQYGDVELTKTDIVSKVAIKEAKFIISTSSGEYIKTYTEGSPSTITYTTNKNEAYKFTTDGSGKISVINIPIGTYHIYEVEAPAPYELEYQDNYDSTNKWVDCGEYEVKNNVNDQSQPNNVKTEISVTNIKVIDMSGYVWIDVPDSKENDSNSLYDKSEQRLAGVKVNLISKTTKKAVTSEVTTNENGEYTFTNIKETDLDNLYVEFNYSGTNYKKAIPVVYNSTNENNIVQNGSRALYDTVSEKDADLTGIVSTYKGTDKNSVYGLHGILFDKLYNGENFTLEYINLGIKELPETSFTVQEDIVNAKINLGGIQYTFVYGKRGNKDYEGVDKVTVNWQSKNDVRAYTADIFPSDVAYVVKTGKDIEATVQYKIDITNTTNYNIPELYVEQELIIKELINSFDNSRYELVDDKWEVVTIEGNITKVKYKGSKYSTGIKYDETREENITFSIKDEAIKEILKYPEGIVEEHPTSATAIAYHKYKRTDYSWNNSITAEQIHYTEDDNETDSAPYLRFKLGSQRETTGIVFKDTNVRESSGEVVGNGTYESGEKTIAGVTVQLIDRSSDQVATLYERNNDSISDYVEIKDAEFITGDDGKYAFSGIIPGEYYLKFIYGDGTYLISDYKSTIVSSEKLQGVIKGTDTDEYWYKNMEANNYSVAIDDLTIRKSLNDADSSNNPSQMEAKTPSIEISNNYTVEAENNEEVSITKANVFDVFNFGIIEQPKQELEIDKVITNIKITNTQGNVVITGNPVIDVMEGVTPLDSNGNAVGYVRIELPEDEIYGSKLTITYEVIVTNVSDINYYETESQYEGWYYLFGDNSHSTEITTTANQVLDYLDPSLTYISSSPDGRVTEKEASNYSEYVDKQENRMYTEYTRDDEYDKVLVIENWEELYSNKKTEEGRKTEDVVEIIAERTLTTEDDDMEIISTAEIIIPENPSSELVPNEVILPEPEDAITSIMPPTGADRQSTVFYTISGIISLTVIAIGAIIIKKKVLR